MKYNEIFNQWKELTHNVQVLQENISACIDEEGYSNEQELELLRFMHKGCYEILLILFGYFD